jgi:hypothetical protein
MRPRLGVAGGAIAATSIGLSRFPRQGLAALRGAVCRRGRRRRVVHGGGERRLRGERRHCRRKAGRFLGRRVTQGEGACNGTLVCSRRCNDQSLEF